MATKAKKFDIGNVMTAAAAGGVFGLGMAAAARKSEMVASNFSTVKPLVGGALGLGLLYFGGSSEKMKAAGYAIIGNAAGTGAAALVDRFVSDDTGGGEEPGMQGIRSLRKMAGGGNIRRKNLQRAIDAARKIAARNDKSGANNPRLEAIKRAAGLTLPGSAKMERVMEAAVPFPWLATMGEDF